MSGIVNYISAFDNRASEGDTCANSFADGTDAPRGCRIPSFYSIDLSARWQATKAFQLFGSVQNVTDRVAPLDPLTYGSINYNPLHFSGAIGRYFTVGAKFSFN